MNYLVEMQTWVAILQNNFRDNILLKMIAVTKTNPKLDKNYTR